MKSIELANTSERLKDSDHYPFVIGNVETATVAAADKARELGYEVDVGAPNAGEGDAGQVGVEVADQIRKANPGRRCRIQGGETTVSLCERPGQGGRNQHLVLAAAVELLKSPGPISQFCLVSGGTDGEDGVVPDCGVAGAWLDHQLLQKIGSDVTQAEQFLANCDSYAFHMQHESLLRIRPTNTNVCDLRIVLTNSCY